MTDAFARLPDFARHARDALAGVIVGGRKRRDDVTIVEDHIFAAISLGDVMQRLAHEQGFEAIARHRAHHHFEEGHAAKHGKFVEQ